MLRSDAICNANRVTDSFLLVEQSLLCKLFVVLADMQLGLLQLLFPSPYLY